MNFRVANEKGMISKEMKGAEEVARTVTREAITMKDDDVILLYLNEDDTMRLGKNVLSVHLKDNVLEVYNEKCNVMCFYEHYDTVRARVFFNAIKAEVEKLITEYEVSQYEQAEAEKNDALYSLSIGNNNFRYKGEYASACIYSVIQGFFSSLSRDEGKITIRELNKGKVHTIEYAKGLAKASVKIDGGQYKTFDYCYPTHNRELQNFIKKEVIL